jgi:phage tail sheath protein FI
VPCGAIAGIMARTDTERGVWKAPAGIGASVAGIRGLAAPLTDADSGALNPLGINAIRTFPVYGTVVWGSRTLRGADLLADDYKYIPIRRLTNYIEESLFRGTKWILFEPNDEPLWAQIRMNVEAFMADLFRRGAFQGNNPGSAYFVRCGADTTTQYDVDRGIVNIQVGFAPLKPAEFVIISLQQMAGQSAA